MAALGYAPEELVRRDTLESALWRLQAAAHYDLADLARQAAILAVGISQAQAFVDGNKRTAAAACVVFLRLNSGRLVADPLEYAQQLAAVADVISPEERLAAEAAYEAWLRLRVELQGPP